MIPIEEQFKLEEVYYSVGPLQNVSGIEQWTFSNDCYDNIRYESNNMFKTILEAQKFLKYMKEYKNDL